MCVCVGGGRQADCGCCEHSEFKSLSAGRKKVFSNLVVLAWMLLSRLHGGKRVVGRMGENSGDARCISKL